MISRSDLACLKSQKAVDQLIRKRYEGNPEKLIADINASLNRLIQSDLAKAGKFLKQASNCFKFLPVRFRARLGAIEARYDHWSGNNKVALLKYKSAIAKLQSSRDFESASRARMGLMDVCMYLGQYEDALRIGKSALRYFLRKKDIRSARVMTNIGNIYHRMDRNRLALRYYDRARSWFEKDGGVALAIADYNRANVYANLMQLEEAEKLYLTAVSEFRNNGMELVACKAEYSLSYLYFLGSRYTEALTTFEKVLDAFLVLGDQQAAAVTRLDLAEINIHLNQYGSALMLGRQAIDDFKQFGQRYEQAKATYFTADALLNLGDFQEATRYLGQSQSLFKREKNRLWQGMVTLSYGRMKLIDRKYQKGLELATEAGRLFNLSGDQRRRYDAKIVLVEALFGLKKGKEGLRQCRRLLVCDITNSQKRSVLNMMGRHYLQFEQFETALDFFENAIKVVEKMLVHLYPDEIRFFYAIDKYSTYLGAAECLLKLGRVEESFLRHSHALALLNQRYVPNSTLSREVPRSLLDIRSELRATLKKISRVTDKTQREAGSTGDIYKIEQKLWANERKIRTFLYPTKIKTGRTDAVGQAYSKWIKRDEVVVNFISIGGTVGAFIVTGDQTRFISCPMTTKELEASLRELLFLMERAVHWSDSRDNNAVSNHYLHLLYDNLIGPLDLPCDMKRIIFLADGIFSQIPYQVLFALKGKGDETGPDIHLIVNPNDLKSKRDKMRLTGRTRSTVFVTSSAELPMVQVEGQKIKHSFPHAFIYAGDGASSLNLKQELAVADGFVHIAAHSSRSSENPLFSKILMNDGPFYPFDLFGNGIKAQLVNLSGCQTAAPGIYYGNSFSLAKIFYQGGARFVLASLWTVSDKVSMIFMAEFYRVLKECSNVSVAYRQAVRRAYAINDNPAFWGSYVLLGI